MQHIVEGLTWYVVFLFSVTAHEAAHAWCAKRGGDWTAYHGGQVSLDPVPHIRREPIGMVLLPLISLVLIQWPFGYASAPYDPLWADRHPRRAALMALAGPLANLTLAILAGLVIRLGIAAGPLESPSSANMTHVAAAAWSGGTWAGVALFLSMLFSLNLMLTLLNLLPLPPLDGSGAVTLLMNEDTATRFRHFIRNPAFAWIGLLVAWKLFGRLFDPLFTFALNILYPGAHYG
jgi:Zn-dependent protease